LGAVLRVGRDRAVVTATASPEFWHGW